MRFLILICMGFFLSPASGARAEEAYLREITILADESLQVPLVDIARMHTARNNIAVNLWFTSASGMVDAIRDGADADIVITADEQALQTLEYLGQLDVYATQAIATCPLVIAVRNDERNTRRDMTLELMGLKVRSETGFTLVTIATPERTEYAMTQKALAQSELLKDRKLQLIGASDARDARRLMEEHNVPALLLASDVFTQDTLKLVQPFPDSIVPPAVYKAAVLAGNNMKDARALIEALHTPDYRHALERYGLGKPAAGAREASGQRARGS